MINIKTSRTHRSHAVNEIVTDFYQDLHRGLSWSWCLLDPKSKWQKQEKLGCGREMKMSIISTETIENEPQIIRAHGVVLVAYLHACSAYWEGSIWIQSADRSRTLGTAGYSWVHMSGVNNNNSITTRPGVPTLAHTGQHNYYVVSSDLTAHYTLPLHTSVGSRDTWLVLTLTPAHDHLTTMVRTLSLQ